MKFKRVSYVVVQHKLRGENVGYKMRSYFKSKEGWHLMIEGKPIFKENIKSKKIREPRKEGFFGLLKGEKYCKEFLEEIKNSNKELLNIKMVELEKEG